MSDDIKVLINSIGLLTEANWNTGLWDNKRNELRKKYDRRDFVNSDPKKVLSWMMDTERESRKNCEERSKQRLKIDESFKNLIEKYIKKGDV